MGRGQTGMSAPPLLQNSTDFGFRDAARPEDFGDAACDVDEGGGARIAGRAAVQDEIDVAAEDFGGFQRASNGRQAGAVGAGAGDRSARMAKQGAGKPRVGRAKRQRGRGSEQVLREVGRRGEHEGERPGPEGVDQDFGGPWNVSDKRVQVLPAPDEQDQAFLRFPALEVKDTFESGPIKRVCAQAVDGLRRVDDNAARPDPVGSLNDARLVGREDGRPSHS